MEASPAIWRPIGALFVEKGLISSTQLEEALAEQVATGKRLGEILVKRNLISSPDLTDALMEQLGREVAKEEGFGTGLWAEIRRRNSVPLTSVPSPPIPEPLEETEREPSSGGLGRKLSVVGDDAEEPDMWVLGDESEFEELRALFREDQSQSDPDTPEAPAAELEEARHELQVRAARIQELETTLLARQERLEKLEQKLETSGEADGEDERAEAAGRQVDLALAQVAQLEAALSVARTTIAELEAGLSAEQQTALEHRERLAAAAEAFEAEHGAHAETARILDQIQASLEAASGHRERLVEELGEAMTRATEVGKAHRQLVRRVAGLEKELDGWRTHASTLGEQLAAAHEEHRRLENERAEQQARATQPDAEGGNAAPEPVAYVCFTHAAGGYRLAPSFGPLPAVGATHDLGGVAHIVLRVGHSPLPFDSRPCVYLIEAPPAKEESVEIAA